MRDIVHVPRVLPRYQGILECLVCFNNCSIGAVKFEIFGFVFAFYIFNLRAKQLSQILELCRYLSKLLFCMLFEDIKETKNELKKSGHVIYIQ